MTEDERRRAFEKAQREQIRAGVRLLNDTNAEIKRLITEALRRVRSRLAGQPTDFQQWQLPQIERALESALQSMSGQIQKVATRQARALWTAGINLTDKPLAAAEMSITGIVPQISNSQLAAMTGFITDRIKDITIEAVNKINTQLGLTVLGAQTPSQAVTAVTRILGEETRRRALTVVVDNLNTIYSIASQERLTAANKVVPMDKVWRRSGKRHQRINHALADGQRVPADKPFRISDRHGEIIRMMFPRDPKAPLGEKINCGCIALPKPREWMGTFPDHKPFSKDELKSNPGLAKLAQAKTPA